MNNEIKRTFHPNGQLALEASYLAGRQNGTERQWHPNGQLALEAFWSAGRQNGIERRWHLNGQLADESNWVDGLPNGVSRRWHANGVLAEEMPVKDGFVEGTVKEWNELGELLGTFEIRNGSGVWKSWHPNGRVSGETTYVNGQFNGRIAAWDETGGLIVEEFQIGGKKVSKRKYLEATKSDPSLPKYNDSEPMPRVRIPSTKYQKSKAPVSDEQRNKHNAFIADLRAKSNQADARQWLADNDERNIGEMTPEDSREMVEEGYKAGARRILAVDIQEDTTNCLIIELPPKGPGRKRAFEWNNELAQNSGFDPDVDWGQGELFVFLD
jgi:antitoxin component YwqK of YwqJK toxin-antitoxin module